MNAMLTDSIWMPLCQRLGATLLHFLWQGALVGAGLRMARWCFRGASAPTCYALSLGALLLLAACPVATYWVTAAPRSRERPLELAAPHPQTQAGAAASAVTPEFAPPPAPAPLAAPSQATETASADPPQAGDSLLPLPGARFEVVAPWIVAAWLVGIGLLSVRRAAGSVGLWRLRRRGVGRAPEAVEAACEQLRSLLGIRRAVRVLASLRAAAPMVIGVWRPVILVPGSALTGLTPRQLEAVLAHELAHIRRWDTAVNLLQTCLETLLFYHPAVWWVSRLAREDREACADEVVLEVRPDRVSYARALAHLAGASADPLATAATGGPLLGRVRRILNHSGPRQAESVLPASVVLAGALLLLGWALWRPQAIAGAARVLEVAAGQSIQQAIDAAPPGATVRVGEGTFEENLVLTKPLTLAGAGWERTIVRARVAITSATKEDLAAFTEQLRKASNPEQADKVRAEWRSRLGGPALEVKGVEGVQIVSLQFTARPPQTVEGLLAEPLVRFTGARKTEIRSCAVVGPFWDGIHIQDGASVAVRDSLVAGLWGTGVAVQGKAGARPASQAHITGCDLRNCYHRCLTLGRGCDTTLLERCRISGSAWHGVRYDNASPTVRDCAIFANARSGIYASGRTAAKVSGNLFLANEMGGMSCWYDNTDWVTGNTFALNQREGISVLGGSRPKLARNIFYGHPLAISCGAIGGDAAGTLGAPVLETNLFWKNEADFRRTGDASAAAPSQSTPLPANSASVPADPAFNNATARDFTLRPDSTARALGVGAAQPLATASSWPLTAGEKAIIPDTDTRDSRAWKKPGEIHPAAAQAASRAQTEAKSLVEEAHRIDSREARDAALVEIRRRLESPDEGALLAGLEALTRVQGVEFDKAAYRDPVRACLSSLSQAVRAAAVTALPVAAPEPSDLDRVIALAQDPSVAVRHAVSGSLVALSGKDLTGKAGVALLALLADGSAEVQRAAIHVLWGARVSPELERRVIELTRETAGGGEALYFGLSTLANKSEAAVDRLIEFLADPDLINVAGRALWGLGQGVPDPLKPKVAHAALRLLEARSDTHIREQCLDRLRAYATTAELPALEALAARPAISPEFKEAVQKTIRAIRQRAGTSR